MISYQRAKAESLGLDAKGGLMERAERIVLLCIGLFLEPWIDDALVWVMWLMLVLITITAVQRFVEGVEAGGGRAGHAGADRPARGAPPRLVAA